MSSGSVADSWEDYIDSEDWQEQFSTLQTGGDDQDGEDDDDRRRAHPEPQEPMVVRVQCESDRGLYTVPEAAPRITILRRPEIGARQSTGPLEPQLVPRGRQTAKSLQQRQVEYAEARQRILGSLGDEEIASQSDSSASSTQTTTEKQQVKLLRTTAVSAPPVHSAVVVRCPRGPDGTSGFKLPR